MIIENDKKLQGVYFADAVNSSIFTFVKMNESMNLDTVDEKSDTLTTATQLQYLSQVDKDWCAAAEQVLPFILNSLLSCLNVVSTTALS